MKVERYNYPSQFGENSSLLFDDIKKMILNGSYILTNEVNDFQSNFANYVGTRYACGTNSGTDALILALRALEIGPGDEVITAANTFYATVAAIRFVGATPVLVDADEETFLIDPRKIESAITGKTKVILPVHLYGKPCEMASIMKLAEKYNLFVVEDAAQAHGAKYHGQSVGSFGIAGCFSFHPSKNLAAAGDGGCVVTSNSEIFKKFQQLRNLGQENQNQHVILGLNTKLDAIQAKILNWKLSSLDMWNQLRNKIADLYKENLKNLPVTFQRNDQEEEHVYHLFQIRTEKRDQLLQFLKNNNVDAVVRYPTPIHKQSAFSDVTWNHNKFPVAEILCDQLLCLPVRPDMKTEDVHLVTNLIARFFNEIKQEI